MVGGLASSVLGPELAKWTKDLFTPIEFAGGYAGVALLAFLTLVLVPFAALPKPLARPERSRGRPLGETVRPPALTVAVLSAMVAYGSVHLIRVSTPLAMVAGTTPFAPAAFVL